MLYQAAIMAATVIVAVAVNHAVMDVEVDDDDDGVAVADDAGDAASATFAVSLWKALLAFGPSSAFINSTSSSKSEKRSKGKAAVSSWSVPLLVSLMVAMGCRNDDSVVRFPTLPF